MPSGTATPQSFGPLKNQKPTTPEQPGLTSLSMSATEAMLDAGRATRLRTMWPKVQCLCPPRSGRIWLLGGAPGSHKTQLVLNLATDMASLGHRVLFVTLELTRLEVAMLALARYSGLTTERLDLAYGREKQALSPEENASLAAAVDKVESLDLRLRVHGAEHGTSLDSVIRSATRNRFEAVFVDHLGIVDRGIGKEVDAIARAGNRLRELCRGVVVPGYAPFVCVTTPLNRRRDEDDHPMLSHLRGSGNLEYDADFVMVLQKRTQPQQDKRPPIVDGFVLKNRQGECPVVIQFEADGARCLITERQREEAPSPHWQQQAEDE